MATKTRAAMDDLYRVPDNGKAELVEGEIVRMSPTGRLPNHASLQIWLRLYEYVQAGHPGFAVGDNAGFHVHLPHRESFSPDAAYFVGPDPGMRFFEGAPAFAAEVRRDGDYGPAAEQAMVEKRADYFAAGTQVVWGADLLSTDVVRVYRASDPDHPMIYRRGERAEAEPAVPGWSMPVNDLFG